MTIKKTQKIHPEAANIAVFRPKHLIDTLIIVFTLLIDHFTKPSKESVLRKENAKLRLKIESLEYEIIRLKTTRNNKKD